MTTVAPRGPSALDTEPRPGEPGHSRTDPPAAPAAPAAPNAPAAPAKSPLLPDTGSSQTVHSESWPLALAVITIGAFMSILDISIVNVAIPTMANQFGVSNTDIEWVSTAYSLALGVIVPVSGWMGQRFDMSRLYAWSVFGFGVTSAMCGLAWDLNSEIAFRILQAIPGGILPVITLTMLYRIVPPAKIGLGMAAYGVAMVFAPATGPTLGGYLVEYHDWRMIFFLNVPVGLIGAVLAFTVLPRFPHGGTRQFDTWGFVTVASGLFTLLLGLTKGADWGWSSYAIRGLLTASALLIALFVVIELEVDEPLLDVRLFRIWSFTNCQLQVGILSSAFFTVLFYLPLFMQHGQGITPMNTGLAMLPEAVAMAISLPAAGLLYDKMGPRWPIFIGMTATAYGTYLLCGITSDMSRWDVMCWTSFRGMGQAFCMVPLMTAGLDEVPSDKLDGASAINNVMQRVTGALGLALLTAVITSHSAQATSDRAALMTDARAQADPDLAAAMQQGPDGMWPFFKLFELKILAQTYSNLFLLLSAITMAGALVALTFKSEKPDSAGGPRHLDIGM
ncbi:MAG TPA: MDR family MFS transporter [Pseudonocardia sp.]|nr:MDR family MFS transporter [Pseudonocardia sp.]